VNGSPRDLRTETGAPGGNAGGALVIGFGSTLRGDDGAGWEVAVRLGAEPRLHEATVVARHQLTPELAVDIAAASLVIFLDASVDVAPGAVVLQRVAAAAAESLDREAGMTHHVGPEGLLALVAELYGRAPAAWLVSIGAASMELGDGLSAPVAAALPAAIEQVVALVAAG
jgi:hydrogenase maturation protease